MKCSACQKEIPSNVSACPACGFSFDDATQRLKSPPRSTEKRSFTSFESIDDARFVPGTMLAGRYRIVGLLGRGGMGEVYRADDLKLGQPVALKFLPEQFLTDGAALARFHREVRVARQVSHRNVCRVYDIGEIDDRHFLSMEFIKGEELSSLLRRIGRLPQDKAVQVARQICAGLAAAHEVGVLHRDLKPSNVMIDEHGNARITDFGLAGLAEEFHDDEAHAGTPAYMAPEQLDGQNLTVSSDIYSLGLVLYEVFTGRKAFEAASLIDLIRLRRSATSPTTPTSLVKDLDPAIEKVIDRCLQKDPEQRPASALQVAAALPGGDPIAAALAAGETPSPEMVAAAPKEGVLKPAVALSMFAALMVGLALVVLLADKVVMYGYVPLEKSPDVLRENARNIIRAAGVSAAATDYMQDFEADLGALDYVARTDARPDRWQDLRDGQPATIYYWYRQSPGYLGEFDHFRNARTNPPPIMSGMAGVKLDTRGRLLQFYSVPPQIDPVSSQNSISSPEFQVSSSQDSGSRPDSQSPGSTSDPRKLETQNSKLKTELWPSLFTAAGLDIANFKPAISQWAPLHAADSRFAWEGVYPEQTTIPIRIEAASYRDKPIYFEIVNPWTRPERQDPPGFSKTFQSLLTLMLTVFVVVLVGSVLLAIRHLRLGRGDRKGALRLAIFVFLITLISRMFSAHHIPTFGEFATVLNSLQDSIFAGGFFWVVYLALEPFVRKRWPERIISWARVLNGDFRDPLVGRDVMIGGLFGIGTALWQLFFFLGRGRFGQLGPSPSFEPGVNHLGVYGYIEGIAGQLTSPLIFGFQFLFLVLLLALVFRRDWLGFLLGWLVFTTGLALLGGGAVHNWIGALVTAGLTTVVLLRFGVLSMVVTIFYLHWYLQFPVTAHLTSWYALGALLNLIILTALALFAFRTSLAGQPLTRGRLLEE